MDIFMSSIESIISKRKKMYALRDDLSEKLEIRVWNDVVANLTLLCLGTSAPEVLLSLIEVLGHNFNAGFIGPGSIVGSAAVNLLIIAFCNVALSAGEVRVVRKYPVFCLTGVFSVFSFFWIFFILVVSSKGVVEVWEAILTLMFYPLLVIGAYIINKKVTLKSRWAPLLRGDEGEKEIAEATFFKNGVLDKASLVRFLREVMNYPGITMQEAAILAAAKLVECEPRSLLWYRMGGVRVLTSGKPLTQRLGKHLQEVMKVVNEQKLSREELQFSMKAVTPDTSVAVVEFAAATVAVTERVGTFSIYIHRSGNLQHSVSVRVQSMDGMAVHGEDYDPVNDIIVFERKQTVAEVRIRIIDEKKYEPTEEFFLRLSTSHMVGAPVRIGTLSIMEIKIIHDESPGVIQFEKRAMVVDESVGVVTLYLERFHGSDGDVTVDWKSIDGTAQSGVDYEGGEGVVKFKHGEVRRFLMLRIINTMSEEKDARFDVEIFHPTDGAILGDIRTATVIITDDDNILDFIENVMTLTTIKMNQLSVQRENWCKQIKEAMMVNGGEPNPSNMDFALHFVCFFWKVLFSLIPPPGLLGGWLQFFTAIFLIGVMATLIGDMASVFGCVVGIEDSVTALVLVGIGTSLPDVFACWIAMKQSKTADEAIGNINGTCSVNVFVGLGLPWTLAACYHTVKGEYFKVQSEGFAFALLLFSACCLLTFVILVVRRSCAMCGNAEVGGPKLGRYVTAGIFTILYAAYNVLASLNIQGVIDL